jgi:hypothetical protein
LWLVTTNDGDHGIPIRDELELELILRDADASIDDTAGDHRGDT